MSFNNFNSYVVKSIYHYSLFKYLLIIKNIVFSYQNKHYKYVLIEAEDKVK